jgi:hypothetical protein
MNTNEDFKLFIQGLAPNQEDPTDQTYAYADLLMYTLDSPRYEWYENSDYQVIQNNVLTQVNEAVDSLGFYPV